MPAIASHEASARGAHLTLEVLSPPPSKLRVRLQCHTHQPVGLVRRAIACQLSADARLLRLIHAGGGRPRAQELSPPHVLLKPHAQHVQARWKEACPACPGTVDRSMPSMPRHGGRKRAQHAQASVGKTVSRTPRGAWGSVLAQQATPAVSTPGWRHAWSDGSMFTRLDVPGSFCGAVGLLAHPHPGGTSCFVCATHATHR